MTARGIAFAAPAPEVLPKSGVPREVHEKLVDLADDGGELHAATIVEEARNPRSVLHPLFEWDNDAAAESYRMVQAARIIRRVRVTVIPADDSPPVTVRAYVARAEIGEGSGGAYVPVESIAGHTAREAAFAETMRGDLLRLRAKYRSVSSFMSTAREVFGVDE
jgi:hypothetical protein